MLYPSERMLLPLNLGLDGPKILFLQIVAEKNQPVKGVLYSNTVPQ
jgi:hypothetical protein